MQSKQNNILVVGAGLAGAVYARSLADHGYHVSVIDKRSHIAGNCFDEIDNNGVRIHRYGPHLFHTSNQTVVDWLSRFTDWVDYRHSVVARLPNGALAPLPVNMNTVNLVFGKQFTEAAQTELFLRSIIEKSEKIQNAEEHLYSVIGRELTNLFFRPYTRKMWNLDLTEVAPSVVQRLSVRMDRNPQYFLNDTFQAMPANGYTTMFEDIFDHPNISVRLNCEFQSEFSKDFSHVFNSMPIDEYYDYKLGELPYRSIRFHTTTVPLEDAQPHAVINYTDDTPFTRETWWHNLPAHHITPGANVTRTVEEPCDYKENAMERYYPVSSNDGRSERVYKQYKLLAENEVGISFIGRCGTYQYLDMHQVVNQSLIGVSKWLSKQAKSSVHEQT